jgi:hypothetical protein
MKVRGNLNPLPFTLEPIPKRPGFLLVRFRENAVQFEETRDEQTESGWEYDEYTLTIWDSGTAEADVEANYTVWMELAKAQEADRMRPPVRDEVLALQSDLAQADETAIELYEANAEQQATNEAQDEALIELYELVGGN